MTIQEMATCSLDVATQLKGRMVGDIMSRTRVHEERVQLGIGVLSILLRQYLSNFTNRDQVLEQIIRAVLQP